VVKLGTQSDGRLCVPSLTAAHLERERLNNEVYDFITALARETGRLLKTYFERPLNHAEYKPDKTLLTEADLAANAYILGEIRRSFPEDDILSEEGNTSFPEDGRPTWIIDPLDGTTNFSQGLHHWGVSIARFEGGWPQAAALSFPAIDEAYSAYIGEGAWLNGKTLRVPPGDSHMVSFFLCDSRLQKQYSTTIRYKPRILGSAAYNFCGLAKGIGVVGLESIPKIWDIAASYLVLSEAGGAMLPLNGDIFPLTKGRDYNGVSIPMLGAADQVLLNAAREKITFMDPAPTRK